MDLPEGEYWPAEVLRQQGIASLEELEEYYSFQDIVEAAENTAAYNRAVNLAQRRAREEAERKR